MTDVILIRYSGPAGSFVLAGDESGSCRLLRSPDAATNFTWESKTFTEVLQFDNPAAFWAWFSRDADWFLARPFHLDPLMAGLIGHFLPSFKRETELNQSQHLALMHWEGAIRRVIPDFEPQQFCSICHCPVAYFPRYPKSLCAACVSRIADAQGRLVTYDNTAAMGYGCQGYYRDTEPPRIYDSDRCYVDGVACKAQEARFGGIVIQKIDHP